MLNIAGISITKNLTIEDYENIKKLCDEKIKDLKTEENIAFILNIQQNSSKNMKIIEIFNYRLNNIFKNNSNSNQIWDSFCKFDFYDNIMNGNIPKEKFIKACENIKKISFADTNIFYNDEKNMSNIMEQIENCDSHVCEIDFSQNIISDEGLKFLIPILQKKDNLKIIDFSDNKISDAGLRQIKELSCCKSLEKIIIKKNYGPSEETLEFLKKDWNIEIIF